MENAVQMNKLPLVCSDRTQSIFSLHYIYLADAFMQSDLQQQVHSVKWMQRKKNER